MKKLPITLLLSIPLLSSCVSTVHQYAARRALVADTVLVLRSPISEVWQIGDQFYAPGYLGKGRGVQRGAPIYSVLYQSPKTEFELIGTPEQEVYVELYHDIPNVATKHPERFCALSSYLTELPKEAKKHRLATPAEPERQSIDLTQPHADAHGYYSYPLAAAAAVAIDLPLSLAMTTALIPTVGIGSICAKISRAASQSQQKAEPSASTPINGIRAADEAPAP